ncbi:hypothetical protein NM688_g191 [Phlebia brevispora]|uniref:Uncharacterized protein n=1 Tax=Phlebia brevispora TaxID=194682 RepID=A0ACC1TEQ4_9APHY|nr:hypothetical protein NM688_g191 [Phlebia brevispora]
MPSVVASMFPPKATFSVDDIPDLNGQVIIVTGGNTGIGKETAKVSKLSSLQGRSYGREQALLSHNAKVYIAGRNLQKVQAAIAELQQGTGKQAYALQLDLANLRSVKHAAEEFQTKEAQLHVLFNSAGVMFPPVEDMTSDGYDLQFGTNVLGHFYFTRLLLPLLLSTAKTTPSGKVRVVNTSSMGHSFVDHINYEALRESPQRIKLGTHKLYFQSKFGNVLFSNELQRRYGDQGIVSISLHPGNLKTDLQRHSSKAGKCLSSALLYPAPMGALTQLYGGTMPEATQYGGKYMVPWARVGEARKETNDPKAAQDLWTWLEDQVKDV